MRPTHAVTVLLVGLVLVGLPSCWSPSVDTLPTAAPRPAPCTGWVALTFDDGPSDSTLRLVEVLRSLQVPAYWFNTGVHSASRPELVRAQLSVPGSRVGNHSWSHPDLSSVSAAAVREELTRTQRLQGPAATLFRPPFGAVSPTVLDEVDDAGLQLVLWHRDSKDYGASSAAEVVAGATGGSAGDIVLLHDGPEPTVEAVPAIVDHYHRRGLCLGTVRESKAPQHPQESPALTFFATAAPPEPS